MCRMSRGASPLNFSSLSLGTSLFQGIPLRFFQFDKGLDVSVLELRLDKKAPNFDVDNYHEGKLPD